MNFISLSLINIPVTAVTTHIWYVDATTGKDSNTGLTQAKAFKTISKANQKVSAGDTVLVKNGTYKESFEITKSGTPSAWITFKAYPGQSPKIINTADTYDAVRISGNYIEINGFNIQDAGLGSAIYAYNPAKGNHDIRVLNNILHDSAAGGFSSRYADYLTVENNIVYRNAFTSPYMGSGISLYQSKNYDNKPGFHNIISGNISYANQDKAAYDDGTTTDGNGIIIDDSRQTQDSNFPTPYTGATLIENNLVFDNGGRGIHVFESDNVTIRNNTAYHDVKDPLLQGTYNAELTTYFSSNISFYNNIAIPSAGKLDYIDDYSQNNKWDYNLFGNANIKLGDNSGAVFGTHNLFSKNPTFVNPTTNPTTANFRLNSKSIAIGKAVTNYPTTDILGNSRLVNKSADLGAYEFVKK
jgi:parallel beta-helix repeat protein